MDFLRFIIDQMDFRRTLRCCNKYGGFPGSKGGLKDFDVKISDPNKSYKMLELPNMGFNQTSDLNIMSSKYYSKNRIQGFKRWDLSVCVD